MPKLVPQAELDAVLQAVARFPEGASIEDIGGAIEVKLPRRTLQRRLALLVEQKRIRVLEAALKKAKIENDLLKKAIQFNLQRSGTSSRS